MNSPKRVLFLIFLLGAGLRVFGLGSESLWLDETSTVRRTGLSFKDLFFDTGSGSQLPLFFWIEKAWAMVAGTGEVALRVPALVFGILLIPAVFLLGKALFGRRAALWGAFFAAINPSLIHYSQDARPYSLFVLLVVIAWVFLAKWVESGEQAPLVGWCLSTAGVLYTHPLGFLVLPSHLVGFLVFPRIVGDTKPRPPLGPFLAGLAVAALSYLPLLIRMREQIGLKVTGGSVADWIPTPSLHHLYFTPVWYFFTPALAGLVAICLVVALTRRPLPDLRKRWSILFLGTVWLLFALAPWVVSFLVTPMYVYRYTLPVLPALLVLLGWGVTRFPKPLRIAAIALFLVASALALDPYYRGLDKAPWRAVTAHLSERLEPGDLVVWDPGFLQPLTDYYLQRPDGVEFLFPFSVEESADRIGDAERVWVVTQERRDYGVAAALSDGTLPGWLVLEETMVNDDFRQNPRGVSLTSISVRLFGRNPTNGGNLVEEGPGGGSSPRGPPSGISLSSRPTPDSPGWHDGRGARLPEGPRLPEWRGRQGRSAGPGP